MVNRVTLKPQQRLQNVNKLGDIYIRSVIIELVVLSENKSTKTFSTRGGGRLTSAVPRVFDGRD